ncbi:uncharacterized protein LOC143625695 [Bidens hawaiensis]|uniref:uncharacterized protein LOC143625695 n=1 Tax=Bidens hawaiensis TaxID=980011 RepID=UPI004048F65B
MGRLEEMMQQILNRDQVTQKTLTDHDFLLKNQQSAMLDMQRTIGDIDRQLNERPPGQFSGSTQQNPAAPIKAITTRSGRVLGPKVRKNEVEVEDEEVMDEEIEMEVPRQVQNTAPVAPPAVNKPVEVRPSPLIDHSRIPYPGRAKHQKYTREYGHFLDIFRQLKINLPFIEALQHMPKYVKFLKDLLKRKHRLGEVSSIPLMGDCSAVVLNRVPKKLSDPDVFTIPVLFGSDAMSHELADLGANINLMSYSLYEKLELGELTTIRMSLSLADRSVKYPRCIIENFLVKVDKFVFPVDFSVLDMEADEKVPIILGRPFLRTVKALIDVYDGKITLRVGDENVTYDVARSMKHPSDQDDFSGMDKFFDYICGTDLVESNGLVDCDDLVEDELCENDSVCEELAEISGLPEMIEVNEISYESEADSVEKPAPLELKVLPSHLEYVYLDEGSNLPVIVSSKLAEEQKTKLIDVLKLHKGVIAWRLSDIQGISPAYCMHRILMKDEYKPVVQPQRHLNPNMQEVVKKEVLKLMDAGMIYPIFDSPWVIPTQVVPMKGGMTVVMNEKNELIPSRTITGWRRCMVAIFQDMIETSMEDFSVYANSFNQCLANLEKMLKRCIETKLMLNWEKCHFMVTEGFVFGHKISRDGIEVDRAKIDTISRLPPPTNVKAIRSFLGHAGFYRRFIKDFSKITRLMTRLLEKDVPFVFDDECVKTFTFSKEKLFDNEIKDKKGAENVATDHLSRLEDPKREELLEEEIGDKFPNESIDFVAAKKQGMPWFSDFANYLANGFIFEGITTQQKKKFFRDVNRYVWDNPFLFKIGGDRILKRCVTK